MQQFASHREEAAYENTATLTVERKVFALSAMKMLFFCFHDDLSVQQILKSTHTLKLGCMNPGCQTDLEIKPG